MIAVVTTLAGSSTALASAAPKTPASNSIVIQSTPGAFTGLAKFLDALPSAFALEKFAKSQQVTAMVDHQRVNLGNIGDVARNIEAYDARQAFDQQYGNLGGPVPNVEALDGLRRKIPNSLTLVKQAIAFRIFESAIFEVALRDGHLLPLSVARRDARNNWQEYVKANPHNTGQLTQAKFESPSAVRGLQRSLTILQQENLIEGPLGTGMSRTKMFSRWLGHAIDTHLVEISMTSLSHASGYDPTNIPSDLPPGM